VVKVQRRDPLLITTTDPRRALVQCFPVPPKGEMQIQLEITQFVGEDPLALPALTETNFTQPEALRHRISNGFTRDRALTETQMQHPSPSPLPSSFSVFDGTREGEPVELTVAIDTSERVRPWLDTHRAWLQALEKSLPPGSTVRFADTRLPRPVITSSLDEVLHWRFAGGVDAAPALQALAKKKTPRPHTIVWIHGPMPVEATDTSSLRALFARPDAPRLIGVLTAPGPDPVMDALATHQNVWVKDDATPESITRAACSPASGVGMPLGGRWPASLSFATADSDGRETSLGKLHAWSRTLQGWYGGKNTDDLARYAASRRLVTPISGAVVLESKEQYQRHGLDPNKAPTDPNPQVNAIAPEPGSLALFLLMIPFARQIGSGSTRTTLSRFFGAERRRRWGDRRR
jgi:hypothetical protein